MADHHTNVLILGSGAAGCTAAIYAARAGHAPLLVTGLQPGGQLTITTDVENYPGFDEAIQGPWLMERMQSQARAMGATLIDDAIVSADLSGPPFVCVGDSGDRYVSETLIIATGASARWLGLPSEARFSGRGVSACATCDGFFFRGKPVVVVGGGNTAVEEALYLTQHASHVTLVHRRDTLRAEQVLQDRLLRHPNVSVRWNRVIDEILGGGDPPGVTGVRLRDTQTGATEEIPCEGVFIAIGHSPNTSLFEGQLACDESGYLITAAKGTATSRPGVFAAGDVQDPVFRQAVTAAGTGCMAALEAGRFLAARDDKTV
ncbi:thioredoxin-disulfide reductase [Pararhodospirillum oryzae]|uniref:Thioredoxin reductase n=1 Tax=Pararhodospirillum oryzae TaxID=478448 RepID=A0A512HAG6_9PROT|nr:thioredoxin-disulfide reductase [Pararhodospirillum oryzae]GEO82435.1 thioredoxin reductase [Pararhodospirillum oryzae]